MCLSVLSDIFSRIEQIVETPSFIREHTHSVKDFTRKRCLGFKDVFFAVCSSQKRSLYTELSTFLLDASGKVNAFSPQAFSKARYKIHSDAFCSVFRETVRLATQKSNLKTRYGYRIFAVDGTSLLLPNTPANRETFGICGNTEKPDASASASIFYDVLNDLVVDAVIGRQFSSERQDCLDMLERTGTDITGEKRLVIMDRGYCSRTLYQFLEKKQYKYLIRIQAGASTPKAVRETSAADSIVRDARNHKIVQRVLRILLPSGETELLVTNLFDEELTVDDFYYLYHLRWGVEGKYLDIKHKTELEKFTGYRPDGIRQDFYAALLLANLSSVLKAAASENMTQRPGRKWDYQISINAVINVMRYCMVRILYHPQERMVLLEAMAKSLENKRSAVRPNRHAERRKPRLVKRHHLNYK